MSKPTYIIAGILIVALSFGGTLFALNLWSGYPVAQAPAAAPSATSDAAQGTSADNLPKVQSAGFEWIGAARLNVQADTGPSVVTGQPILRLMPTSEDGFHTLAGKFSGLNKNQVYRITAWAKPVAGGNIQLDAGDHPSGNPTNASASVFDLTGHTVLSASGAIKDRGVELGPNGWQKVWLDLTTSDGQFAVAIRPASAGNTSFKGDGNLGVILGGVEANPKS